MSSDEANSGRTVAVIGGGPAGLMAAETLIRNGHVRVDVYDAMPSVARKFLLAGKGGLNLTHAEPFELFLSRYADRRMALSPMLEAFDAEALRAWARELGTETFIGTSGRVFPVGMKAAPLLRAWLHRLREAGVHFHMRHRWCGWVGMEGTEGGAALRFATPQGISNIHADAVVLALGGGSWARLGSDGAWVDLLAQRGIPVARLRPANCGFDVAAGGWSAHFRERFAGQPVKSVLANFVDAQGVEHRRQGEFVVTETGVEGSLIYAMSAALRDAIEARGMATLTLDLAPAWTPQRIIDEVSRPRGSRSLSSHLQSRLGLKGVKVGLLRELVKAEDFADSLRLAAAIKALPLRLGATRPLDEAISSAGGVVFEALDTQLMIRTLPGVFCAGEMLDWEAPTGGYLLTACFATGRAAGLGVLRWLDCGEARSVGTGAHPTASGCGG